MTIRHMKIFAAVFRCGSMTRAAEQLHLAQPSVSVAVRELEEYYGVRLFERAGRRLVPTTCGRELYGYAGHIVSLFSDADCRLRSWDTAGTLRVGASITIGVHLLPWLVRRYHEQSPELRIEAVVEPVSRIEQRLIDNDIDLGLIETQPSHPELGAEPFARDEMCAVVPPASPLAAQETVSLEELAQYPFLLREPGSSGRTILEACFALRQLRVRPAWESASTQAILRAVAEGLGVAVLPERMARRDAQDGAVKLLPLADPIERTLHIVWHKSKYITENMVRFQALCRGVGAENREI